MIKGALGQNRSIGQGGFCVVTFNCKNLDTASCSLEELSRVTDILLIQEHWYFDCQLDKINLACDKFVGCGKAVDTGDPILPVQMPRGYGGVAVLWRETLDHLIVRLPDGGNRIQCVEVKWSKPVLLVSAYLPCRGVKNNDEEYQDCIAQLTEICCKYSDTHMILIGGDFNEDIYSPSNTVRKNSLQTFLKEFDFSTQETGKTYINPDGVDTSTIDYVFL
ncbi:MAG: endonuclease/exonuclease/phosphatase family protein [Candidatus Thiodiazotropha sp.]